MKKDITSTPIYQIKCPRGCRTIEVHIGDDRYFLGKYLYDKNTRKGHRHLYKNGKIFKDIIEEDTILENLSHRDLLKIYILTNILDDVNNWELNLNIIPITETLKVIYDNGTVKNINFSGVFEQVKINRTHNNTQQERILPHEATVRPVAYRIPTI